MQASMFYAWRIAKINLATAMSARKANTATGSGALKNNMTADFNTAIGLSRSSRSKSKLSLLVSRK
jgi:hypothetical protein